MNITARELIADAGYGTMATIKNGLPRIRPMAFIITDDGKLWSSTWRISGKVAEMEQNQDVEVCFVDSKKNQLRISGKVDITGDNTKKAELLKLNPKVSRHFPTADHPQFVHIEIVPTHVRMTPPGFSEYEDTAL